MDTVRDGQTPLDSKYTRSAAQYHTITLPVTRFYPNNGTFSTELGVLYKDARGEDAVSMNLITILVNDYPKYRKLPGYAHYQTAQFYCDLAVSFECFDSLVIKKTWPNVRPSDPPNSLVDESLTVYSNNDLIPLGWGPDEDYYLAEQEGWWS